MSCLFRASTQVDPCQVDIGGKDIPETRWQDSLGIGSIAQEFNEGRSHDTGRQISGNRRIRRLPQAETSDTHAETRLRISFGMQRDPDDPF